MGYSPWGLKESDKTVINPQPGKGSPEKERTAQTRGACSAAPAGSGLLKEQLVWSPFWVMVRLLLRGGHPCGGPAVSFVLVWGLYNTAWSPGFGACQPWGTRSDLPCTGYVAVGLFPHLSSGDITGRLTGLLWSGKALNSRGP